MPDLVERIATILAEHELQVSFTAEGTGCKCGAWDDERSSDPHLAHVAPLIAAEFRSLIPSVAYKAEGRGDADAFREAAAKLDAGYQPGGSNMTYAVSQLCRAAAGVLEGCTADELASRAQRGWAWPAAAPTASVVSDA